MNSPSQRQRLPQRIAGPYQDVLTWARQLGSATTFMERINRAGLGERQHADLRRHVPHALAGGRRAAR